MDDLSQFTSAVRKATEGVCPLCDVALADLEQNQVHGLPGETVESITAELGATDGFVTCFRCRLGWRVDGQIPDVNLISSRRLTREELKALQDLEETDET